MIHHHNIGHTTFVMASEIVFTHVIIGKRDPAFERPPMPEGDPSPEEKEAAYRHAHRTTAGFYEKRLLAWAESEAHAAELAARFTEPEWTDVIIEPLNERRIPNG